MNWNREYLHRQVSRLENFWGRIHFPGLELILLLFFWLVFIKWFESDWTFNYPPWGRFSLIIERRSLTTLLVIGALFTVWIPRTFLTTYCFCWGLSSWLVNSYLIRQGWSWDTLILPLLILILYVSLKFTDRWKRGTATSREIPAKWVAFILICWGTFVFLLAALGMGWFYLQNKESQLIRLYWLIHPETLLLLYLQVLFMGPFEKPSVDSKSSQSFLLHPINFMSPQAWPSLKIPTTREDRKILWMRGFALIVGGQFLIGLSMKLVQYFHLSGVPAYYWIPLRQYFPFLLMVMGTMTFVEGMSKLFQFDAPPLTRGLLTCPLPSELWERGNSYLYYWVYHWIYIPAFRWLRRPGWALFTTLCFVVFQSLLAHDLVTQFLYSDILKIQSSTPWLTLSLVVSLFVWIGLWMVLFKISQRLRAYVYKNQWRQYLGAVLTHLIVAYSFYFAFKWIPKTFFAQSMELMK